jgi:uncharacterized membrane protein YoaK (UPF0700 family)
MRTSLANVIRKDSALVLLLSWTAGSMDAISYIAAHVLPANMTGNTVLLGMSVGLGHQADAIKSAIALGGYILGVALGVLLVDRHNRPQSRISGAIAGAVAAEAGALAVFSIVSWNLPILGRSTSVLHVLIVVAGIAMGIQSATVKKLNLPGVVTTYITGTITSLTSGFMRGILRWNDRKPARELDGDKREWESRLEIQAGVFIVYGLAACMIATLQKYWPGGEPFSPLIAVVLAFLTTFRSETNPQPTES